MIKTQNKQIKSNQHGSSESQQKSDIPLIQNSQVEESTSGKMAREEFFRIKNMINVVSSAPLIFKTSDNKCLDNPRWCLPDVNCTARVTMSKKAEEAFISNKEFCKVMTKID